METPESLYVAQIIDDETREVEWQSKPTTFSQAEHIAAGSYINLNHEKYSVAVVAVEDLPPEETA
jgi:hypothetical protein